MPHINLKLTFLEAVELSAVTDNGYGDGDYYKEMSQKDHATFRRARDKLLKAIQNYNEEGKPGANILKQDTSAPKKSCTCGNPEFGFDCICEWIEKHPGRREFACEFCGLYNASEPRCSECENITKKFF